MTFETYWAKVKRIGWLQYVPKHLQAEMRTRLKKIYKSDPDGAYLCLAQTGLDAECIDGPESYVNVLQSLANESNGLFRPTQLKAELIKKGKKQSIKVMFRHERKSFSIVLPFEFDFIDTKVIDLVNEAMESSGQMERFVELPNDDRDQLVFIAIVPPSVYEKAVSQKRFFASCSG